MEEQEKDNLCKGTVFLNIKELEELFEDIADLSTEIRDLIKEEVDNNNTYIITYLLGEQVKKALFDIGDILTSNT